MCRRFRGNLSSSSPWSLSGSSSLWTFCELCLTVVLVLWDRKDGSSFLYLDSNSYVSRTSIRHACYISCWIFESCCFCNSKNSKTSPRCHQVSALPTSLSLPSSGRVFTSPHLFLRYLNELGAIVYFPFDPQLKDMVVIDPPCLTNILSTLFTTKVPAKPQFLSPTRTIYNRSRSTTSSSTSSFQPFLFNRTDLIP